MKEVNLIGGPRDGEIFPVSGDPKLIRIPALNRKSDARDWNDERHPAGELHRINPLKLRALRYMRQDELNYAYEGFD